MLRGRDVQRQAAVSVPGGGEGVQGRGDDVHAKSVRHAMYSVLRVWPIADLHQCDACDICHWRSVQADDGDYNRRCVSKLHGVKDCHTFQGEHPRKQPVFCVLQVDVCG